jgi:soluble lytic murein transglycosylase-like protein
MASAPVPAPAFPTTLAPNNPDMLAQAAEAKKYEQFIRASAAKFGLTVAVVCGIGSRESRWGLALKPPGPTGTGDATPRNPRPPLRPGPMPPDGQGYGRGLMQIDFDAQPFARTGNWKDAAANIDAGCQILNQSIQFFAHHSGLSVSALRAGIAGYNRGPGLVLRDLQNGLDVDANTAHHDYSKDVLNRAGWFEAAGW